MAIGNRPLLTVDTCQCQKKPHQEMMRLIGHIGAVMTSVTTAEVELGAITGLSARMA
ncbi:hypothetical protein [Yersinia aleksiciae]|uniref:hypothetical protein n=1 Tax=Yersinia aleksiciae TaxID=263819 RepID=UPI000ACB0673|nr:hypothetical protein [Yersinia aleksiciae]